MEEEKCSRCGSKWTVKHGFITTVKRDKRPRRKCQNCGHTFYPKEEMEGKK